MTFHREADGSVRRATAWQGREVALRGAEGRVTGMRASSGRVRNLWFERQE